MDDSGLNYKLLAKAVVDELAARKFRIRSSLEETRTGNVIQITGDDCETFTFKLGEYCFRFEKEDHESWVETVKYAKRNGKTISVSWDMEDDDTEDGKTIHKPTDIHEL